MRLAPRVQQGNRPAPKPSLRVTQVVGTQEFRRSGRSKTGFLEELGFVENFEDT